MKRSISALAVAAVVAALTVFAGLTAGAEPSDACGSADPVAVSQLPNGAVVCISGTGAADGSVTIAGTTNEADPTQSTGYVVADGDSTNPGALSGYIGAEAGNPNDAGGAPALVGCSSGNYDPAGPNNVIVALDGNPPNVDPASPCFPAAPEPPSVPA